MGDRPYAKVRKCPRGYLVQVIPADGHYVPRELFEAWLMGAWWRPTLHWAKAKARREVRRCVERAQVPQEWTVDLGAGEVGDAR